MLVITRNISIDEREIHLDFVRSSGPGGQNVNKVATAAQLRFDAANCPSLTPDVRKRLLSLAGRRATAAGEIVIDARRFRSQQRNRQDAIERFSQLVRRAARRPRIRRKTRPTAAARRERLEQKRRRSLVKKLRSQPGDQ